MKNKKVLSFILTLAIISAAFSTFLCLPPMTAKADGNTIIVTSTANAGTGSLRAAIASAEPGDTITFRTSTFSTGSATTITLTAALPDVKNNVTIQGHLQTSGNNRGKPAVVIARSAVAGTFLFRILNSLGSITLYGLEIKNGATSDANVGGGVYAPDTVTITDCTFTGNSATNGGGGGIFASSSITATNCTFMNNTANSLGGGIYASKSITATDCNFTNNTASGITNPPGGGGISTANLATVTNCTFEGNRANNGGGGGIFAPTIAATNCNFMNNTANEGGGVYTSSSSSPAPVDTLINCTFTGNRATKSSGAIYSYHSVTAEGCTFSDNYGGTGNGTSGIWVGVFLTATSCSFVNNTGSVLLAPKSIVTDCIFTGNTGNDGGAMVVQESSTVTNCTFTGNKATKNGGAICSSTLTGSTTAINCTFTGNSAATRGGAIDSCTSFIAKNCIFTGNIAKDGGAIFSSSLGFLQTNSSVISENCIFTGNTTTREEYSATIFGDEIYLYHSTVAANIGNGVCDYDYNNPSSPMFYAYNSIITGNSGDWEAFHVRRLGSSSSYSAPTGGKTLIEGINNVTHAAVFGENIPDAAGIIKPIGNGIAVGNATALKAEEITVPSDVEADDVIATLGKDVTGAFRPSTDEVSYGAVEIDIPVKKIILSGAPANGLAKGKTVTLKATITPTNAANQEVTWSSSNTKIATVNASGKVTAVAPGSATITATATDGSNVKGTANIMVPTPVTKITLSGAPANGLIKGKTVTLKATVTPTNATNKAVTWSSSDTKIATVSTSGKVTAKSPGTVTIKATAKDGSGKSASVTITVHQYVTMKIGKSTAIMNGTQTTIDSAGTKPFIISGKTMLPLRFVGEKMGGNVKYVNDKTPITMSYGNTTVEFRLGNKQMKVITGSTTQTITLDVAAQKVGGKTYIPLRAISQALGFDVYYEAGTEYIVVNSPKMTVAIRNERLAEAKRIIK